MHYSSVRTFLIIASIVIVRQGFTSDPHWYWVLLITVPGIVVTSLKRRSKQTTIRPVRNQNRKSASIT